MVALLASALHRNDQALIQTSGLLARLAQALVVPLRQHQEGTEHQEATLVDQVQQEACQARDLQARTVWAPLPQRDVHLLELVVVALAGPHQLLLKQARPLPTYQNTRKSWH